MSDGDLWVDPDQLYWTPADVTVPGVPAVTPGADPMSQLIAAVMPTIADEVTRRVAETRAREERFADNLAAARAAYQDSDAESGQHLQTAAETFDAPGYTPPAPPGGAADPAAGAQLNQLSQLMGMSMQIAQQAAQIPMSLIGMAAAAPQGIMQGLQGAVQQVGALAEMDAAAEAAPAEPVEAAEGMVEIEPAERESADATAGQGAGERAPAPPAEDREPAREPVEERRVPAQTRPAQSASVEGL
ncbi:PE domain-containing protein [uncultured Mycolicibacterium sp.]|uniref:PE domain-containing protein n=1 Tax=uncultured Mycolicibacterium sp. TaxID=2320817 RepID=UPI00261FFD19|nr:PE domain-containing protein [uncultured Mycolicibacterium sp.]